MSDKTRALTERYLAAVKPMLPGAQQDDILAELRESIEAQIEEREAELGRPLKPVEVEAVLKTYGHPIIVASRYGPQRTLIGPTLFPVWWFSLRICLAVLTVVYFAGFVVRLIEDGGGDVLHAASRVWFNYISTVFFVVGIVTVAAAVAQRLKPGPFESWSLKDLAPMRMRTAGRLEVGFALAFEILGLIFWALLPFYWERIVAIFADGRSHSVDIYLLQPSAIWWPTLWAIMLAIAALQVVARAVQFVWPDRVVRTNAANLALNLAGIAFAGVALSALPLFQLPPDLPEKMFEIMRMINLGIQISLYIMLAVNLAKSATYLYRIGRALSPNGSPRPAR